MFDTRNDLPPNTRTGISRETDKHLWFLEAHLHAKR
jgi:DNA-binding ferritin-like protein